MKKFPEMILGTLLGTVWTPEKDKFSFKKNRQQ
jgi:hypothetical protein